MSRVTFDDDEESSLLGAVSHRRRGRRRVASVVFSLALGALGIVTLDRVVARVAYGVGEEDARVRRTKREYDGDGWLAGATTAFERFDGRRGRGFISWAVTGVLFRRGLGRVSKPRRETRCERAWSDITREDSPRGKNRSVCCSSRRTRRSRRAWMRNSRRKSVRRCGLESDFRLWERAERLDVDSVARARAVGDADGLLRR